MKTLFNYSAKCWAICIFCLYCSYGRAQAKKKMLVQKLYFQSGLGMGNNKAKLNEWGIQAVLKNKLIVGFSRHNARMQYKDIPSDYRLGYTDFMGDIFYDGFPGITINTTSLTAGTCFAPDKRVWLTAEAGISLVKGNEPTFTSQSQASFFFYTPSNYAVKREDKTVAGALLRADINWAFTSFAGIGCEVFTNINSMQSFTGFQVKLIIGKLRSK